MSTRSCPSTLSLLTLTSAVLVSPAPAQAGKRAVDTAPPILTTLRVASQSPANASMVPAVVAFFGYGDAVFETGPLPKAWVDKHPELRSQLAGKRAGYKCTVLTLFWAVLWRSDCTAVAFAGKKYLSEDRLPAGTQNWIADLNRAIAAQYKPADMKLSFWARHGRWILGGIALLLLLGQIVRRRRQG